MPPPQEIIRPYQGTINHDPLISKALLRPYFLGGGGWGVIFQANQVAFFHPKSFVSMGAEWEPCLGLHSSSKLLLPVPQRVVDQVQVVQHEVNR